MKYYKVTRCFTFSAIDENGIKHDIPNYFTEIMKRDNKGWYIFETNNRTWSFYSSYLNDFSNTSITELTEAEAFIEVL